MSHDAQSKIHFVTQDDCFKHVYRRTKDTSTIFERPERLRFVNLGLAAAIAWNSVHHLNSNTSSELLIPSEASTSNSKSPQTALSSFIQTPQVTFSKSTRKITCNDPSFDKVHDQPNQSTTPPSSSTSVSPALATKFTDFYKSTNYLDQLIGLCRRASELHHLGLSEVPEHLPQGDLYLSIGSEPAILGAIGTCYTAIDSILKEELVTSSISGSTEKEIQTCQYKKAFVNIRPPGHHCTDSEPMGFCWVNNVLLGCMYSYLTYGIDRICIVDIDLHHGNGSQQIVWNLNSQADAEALHSSSPDTKKTRPSNSSNRRPLRISYSSLHDINSYPCEDGDPDRIKEASLNICVGNSINQFIQNLHIQDWSDEIDFFNRLYPKTWTAFEKHMLDYFRITHARPDRSLIFVSAGFDACEYETGQMSRFAKKLPASFYNRFARDIGRFSDLHCNGRLISVLEGGYSEQTLTGSSLSYLLGSMDNKLTNQTTNFEKDCPWSLNRINQLLKLCKKGDSNRKSNLTNKTTTTTTAQQESPEESNNSKDVEWINETRRLFEHVDSFDQVKSELRLEEKQIKLQQALTQFALEPHSPEGLRRSQRHASKKIDSTPPNLPSTHQSSSESNTQVLKSPHISSSSNPLVKSSQSSSETSTSQTKLNSNDHNSSIKSCSIDDKKEQQSIDQLLKNLKLVEDPLRPPPTNIQSEPKEEEKEEENLRIPINNLDPFNPTPTPTTTNTTNPTNTGIATTVNNENPKIPKVKLVWKAGGIFGTSDI